MGAMKRSDLNLKDQDIQHPRTALVSTKEAFGFFCLLTKETRRKAVALRNAFDFDFDFSFDFNLGSY